MIYAVNIKTKEHRRDVVVKHPDWVTVEADAYGWIEWPGGECPLPDGAGVQVKTNIGIANAGPAGEFRWSRQSRSGDIIAYRPILDAKPEPVEWDGSGLPPVGARVEIEDGCKGTVLAVAHLKRQGARAWLELDDGDQRVPSVECIRPIRSEEDMAVEALIPVMRDAHRPFGEKKQTRDVCQVIYRAIRDGKVPGIKLEESP